MNDRYKLHQFYQGKEKSKEEIIKLIEKTKNFHFTGIKSVNFGIEQNLVDKNKILIISKIPHAEVVVASD